MVKDIVLIGYGGHAKSIIDTLEKQKQYQIVGYVDSMDVSEYRGYRRVGEDEDLEKIYMSGIHNAVIAVGFMGKSQIRNRLYEQMKKIGYKFPVIIDDSAVIASDAVLCEGTYVGKRAVINADANIGKMCIINTGAIVEHECHIGDFSHIAVGAVLCGRCSVGENTLIGANATVIQERSIGDNVIVGAGCTIKSNVDSQCICKVRDASYTCQKIMEGE